MACGGRIREEFHLQSFYLTHPDRRAFTRTPWMRNQIPFLLYRSIVFMYQLAVFVNDTSLFAAQPRSLAYLTNWGFAFLTVHTTWSTALCFVDYFSSRYSYLRPQASVESNLTASTDSSYGNEHLDDGNVLDYGVLETSIDDENVSDDDDIIQETTQELPWPYKLFWVVYNISFTGGLFISIAFWTLQGFVNVDFVLHHAINSVVIVIDILISGLPIRLLHFVYPTALSVVYVAFNVIYWALGGKGPNGEPVYNFLDYSKNPGMAVTMVTVSAAVVVPLCHVIIFGLAIAREKLVDWLER